jgi:hypothetical protein
MLAKYKGPSFTKFGNGDAVTPDNLYLIHPDPYLNLAKTAVPFSWLGFSNQCSNEFGVFKDDIKRNGGKAVGLVYEIAALPPFSKLEGIWYQNLSPIEGLKIKLSIVDMKGDPFVDLPNSEIDLSQGPITAASLCGGCQNSPDTFRAYYFNNSGDKLTTSACNTAILRLEVLEEPSAGLMGNGCDTSTQPFFEGALVYTSFCNLRDRVYHEALGDMSCLDKCRTDTKFAESKRGKELV